MLVRCPQIEEHCPETIIGMLPKKGPPGVGEKLRASAAAAERCHFQGSAECSGRASDRVAAFGLCRIRCEELEQWDLTAMLTRCRFLECFIDAMPTKIRKRNGCSHRSGNVVISQWSRAAGWSLTTKLAVGVGLAAAAVVVIKMVKAK